MYSDVGDPSSYSSAHFPDLEGKQNMVKKFHDKSEYLDQHLNLSIPLHQADKAALAVSNRQPPPEAPKSDPELNAVAELLRTADPLVLKIASEGAAYLAHGEDGFCLDDSTRLLTMVLQLGPRNTIEALLALQMVALHRATLRHAVAMHRSNTARDIALFEGGLNKLSRTFSILTDTLGKQRNGGQQTVRVERVTVEEGGQAIVGNFQGGGECK